MSGISGMSGHGLLLVTSAAPEGPSPAGGKRANEHSTLASAGRWDANGGRAGRVARATAAAGGCCGAPAQQAPLKVLSSNWGALMDFSLGARIDQ